LRVEDFLSAAERLFAEKGYRQTTMEDIARSAEYGTGTIYRYFESKDALYGELFERKLAAYLDHLRERLTASASPRARLRTLVHAKMDFFRQNREFLEIFAQEFVATAPSIDAALTPEALDLRAQCLEVIRDVIKEGLRSGDFRATMDPDLAVAAISGLSNELLLHCLRSGDVPTEKVEAFMTDFIENGLAAGPP